MTSTTTDPLLKRFHNLAKSPSPSFHHGMHTQSGRDKRNAWLGILKQLRRVQRFAAASAHHPSPDQQQLLSHVKASILDVVSNLIHADQFVDDVETTKRLCVWSSPQNARLAIVQEAIAIAHSRRDAPLISQGKPPLVILVTQCLEETRIEQETNRRNFLDSWSSTCYGVAELLTIQAESSAKVRESLHHLFEGFTQCDMFPVLMVVHVSEASTISSDLTSVRHICQLCNVRLCAEGSGLAMLAQSNRPSDPEACVSDVDVMLLDPASWFGFRMCALVSWHKLVKIPVLREFKDHYSQLLANSSLLKDHDETHGLATAPVLNLWTVLSRIGLNHFRDSTDAVTLLAESLVRNLGNSPNIVTGYEGISCLVTISYALSREDRLLPKEKSQEHVSLVNDVIFANLREDSDPLCIQQSVTSEGRCLHFVPARLLSAGTLWIPPIDVVDEYSRKLQDTVDKYESCSAASVAFRSCVAKCHEIQFIDDMSEQPELHLSFGAFRIVPVEMRHTWNQKETSIEVVEGLTRLVAREMTETPHDVSTPKYVVQEEMEEARALAEQFNRNRRSILRPSFLSKAFNKRWSFPHGYDGGGPLPFDVFLHRDSGSRFHDFMTIEPRESCRPGHAVNQATVASDIVITCVMKVLSLWRADEITFEAESEEADRSVSGDPEIFDLEDQYVEAGRTKEDHVLHADRSPVQTSDNLNYDDGNLPFGSDISCPTRSSFDENYIESSQDFAPEAEQDELQGNPSVSSGYREQEAVVGPLIACQDSAANTYPKARRNYQVKDVLSMSTIDKSSRGVRTDEETSLHNHVLPTADEDVYSLDTRGASKASDPVSTVVKAVPIVETANSENWFQSWRTRGWGYRQSTGNDRETSEERDYENDSSIEESDDESDDESSGDSDEEGDGESTSSMSRDESYDDNNRESENEDDSSAEDSTETQEADSSSSDRSLDDRRSDDETSHDTDRENRKGTEDSIEDTSSSNSSDADEESPIRTGRKLEYCSTNKSSRASRLLTWMRSGRAQQRQREEEGASSLARSEDDSEGCSTTSQSQLEDREAPYINTSEEEDDSLPGSRSRSSSSNQRRDDDTSDESAEGSTTGSESRDSDRASDVSDEGRQVCRTTRKDTSTRAYGFGWFGAVRGPSSSRATKSTVGGDSEMGSSVETESETQENGWANRIWSSMKMESADHSESDRTESDRTESTDSSRESCRSSLTGEPSDTSNSSGSNVRENSDLRRLRVGKKVHGPRQKRNSETSSTDGSSATSDEDSSSSSTENATGGQSFFDWILPSWATTPPKLGKRKTPIRGVSYRRRALYSAQSSTDSDSDESCERNRRTPKSKNPTSSGVWYRMGNSLYANDGYRRTRT